MIVSGMTCRMKSVVLPQGARLRVVGERLGVERRRIDVHADARLHEIDDRQADQQRHRTHHLEVQQRIAAGLADLLHVFHAGDAEHDGAEDDRGDDHLDQLDEAVAERLHRLAGRWIEVAEQHADHDRADDLEVERLVQRLPARRGCVVHGRSPVVSGRPMRSSPEFIRCPQAVRVGRAVRRRQAVVASGVGSSASRTAATNASGWSACSQWPASATVVKRTCGKYARNNGWSALDT